MAALSIVAGPPLSEEEGLGTLTLGGWLREVTQAHAGREALVFHGPDGVVRWSHDDLWAQANVVARSLVACGVGKGTRVGVLMTNRPEFLSAVFGVALAGGVAATLSTFSTPAELDHLVQSSACSVLLLERNVLKKDFGAILADLEPAIGVAGDGRFVRDRLSGPGEGHGPQHGKRGGRAQHRSNFMQHRSRHAPAGRFLTTNCGAIAANEISRCIGSG